jgi:hypothetical protein
MLEYIYLKLDAGGKIRHCKSQTLSEVREKQKEK